MIEHPVEDDLHAAIVHLAYEPEQERICRGPLPCSRISRILRRPDGPVSIWIRAEVVVNVVVEGCVVLVEGRRFENGVEIDGVDAEVLQVVQLIDDALQVPDPVFVAVVE